MRYSEDKTNSDEELERESLVTMIDMQTVQGDGQSMRIVVYI